MDIWSLQQSSWLPLMISRVASGQASNSQFNMLSATNLHRPAFNTRDRTAQHTSTEDTTPQPQSDAATPDVTDTPTTAPNYWPQIEYRHSCNAENGSILQMNCQMTVKWKNTQTWSWSLLTCESFTLQTYYRHKSEISGSSYTQAWKYTVWWKHMTNLVTMELLEHSV